MTAGKNNILYIVDKNVLVYIRDYLNYKKNKENIPLDLSDKISKIKKLDLDENAIGMFSSVIEGENKYSKSINISRCDEKLVGAFFEHALTDCTFYQKATIDKTKNVKEILSSLPLFENIQGKKVIDFLIKANKIFLSTSDLELLLNQLKPLFISYCKVINPIIVILILQCVFNYHDAECVLKIKKRTFSKSTAYNAISDVLHIAFSVLTQNYIEELYLNRGVIDLNYKKVVFFTFDSGLHNTYSLLLNYISFVFSEDPNLFPKQETKALDQSIFFMNRNIGNNASKNKIISTTKFILSLFDLEIKEKKTP